MKNIFQKFAVLILVYFAIVDISLAREEQCDAVVKWAKVYVHSSSEVVVAEGDQTCTFAVDGASSASKESIQILLAYAYNVSRGGGQAEDRDWSWERQFYEMLPLLLATCLIKDDNENELLDDMFRFVQENSLTVEKCTYSLQSWRSSGDVMEEFGNNNISCSANTEDFMLLANFSEYRLRLYLPLRPWRSFPHAEHIEILSERFELSPSEIEYTIKEYKQRACGFLY